MISEIKAIYRNDPAVQGWQPILYPWLHALIVHKHIAHPLYNQRFRFMARAISQIMRLLTGIEIHPWAKLGNGWFIDHGMGTVIGETTEIGDNFILYHNVTLWWTGKHRNKRHPTIGDNVVIGTGAILLWPIIIGDNVQIGAGANIVMHNVPSDTTVVGFPAKIVRRNGQKVDEILPRTNAPLEID